MVADLNCDMGEGAGNDEIIMPFITSASIACGFHAGNAHTIRTTIELALKHGVKIGAHPSYQDRESFGRREMVLSPDKVYAIVIEQLIKVDLIAKETGTSLYHVKPHGALYNMAAKDRTLANAIAMAVKDFDETLFLYGLSGSCLISEAKAVGLKTASEVFGDRTYNDDGTLTSRTQPGALIGEETEGLRQVMQMVTEGTVTSLSGKTIPIVAETICIHGDGRRAPFFAKKIREGLLSLQTN
jgi:5-oxoprolinase (ATP-hydrolysing) subunit A